jgi:acyl carrier protein
LRAAARCRIVAHLAARRWIDPMSEQNPAERELAQLLVESLNLEDVDPAQIDPEAALFGDGLGLDSIDALELALAVSKQYGFQLRSDSEENRRIFGSLRALSAHIEQSRAA